MSFSSTRSRSIGLLLSCIEITLSDIATNGWPHSRQYKSRYTLRSIDFKTNVIGSWLYGVRLVTDTLSCIIHLSVQHITRLLLCTYRKCLQSQLRRTHPLFRAFLFDTSAIRQPKTIPSHRDSFPRPVACLLD